MFLNRFLYTIKNQSRETLRAWSYQCESIIAQRSRRIQQLLSFYHRVYGTQGLKHLWRAYYRRELQSSLRSFMLSAVGIVSMSTQKMTDKDFDWSKERLSLDNFMLCSNDIEFINSLSKNKLCEKCKAKKMKYCYCSLGNRKCLDSSKKASEASISSCYRPFYVGHQDVADGTVLIKAADDKEWEPYFSKNDFSVWRREERTSMYSYKVYARFDDITADDFMHVQTNLDYRRHWDDTAVRLELISEDPTPSSNSHLIYWEMQWPRLFANRDYVYCRRYFKDEKRKVILVCSHGATHRDYPIFSGKVRVLDYWSLMVIKPFRNFHEPGLHFILTYYDDPGVSIPQNIKSWVQQKQMPDFLTKMYVATKNYACTKALDMKEVLSGFAIIDNEYSANASRGSWMNTLHQKNHGWATDKSER